MLFFCMVSMLSVFVHAASLQVTYHINDATEAVTSEVSTEGNLVTLLGDNAMNVTQLSVIGNLNDADISLLQEMAGKEGTGKLKSLNLSEATFTTKDQIHKEDKRVPESIFQNCKNLQQVNLSNMTEIGKWAFNNCALTEITIPASVTIIQDEAFKGCSALNTLKFEAGTPESEKELVLKEEAFFGCVNMDLANGGVLPSRIISIAARTFQGCGITKLTLPTNEKLTGITRKLDFNGVQTDNMGALGYGAFFGCSKLTDLTIPANVTVINEVVFQDCNLKNVTFADATKITEIQKYAFTNNQNLTGIFANKDFANLKTIGEGAFKNCFKLTDDDFKNLTKNHSYELLTTPVGIKYGSDIEQVRQLLIKQLWTLQSTDEYGRPLIDPAFGFEVRFDGFGDSSVNLNVMQFVLVERKGPYAAKAKEVIYNALNAGGIEIPFPQRDVYIKQAP